MYKTEVDKPCINFCNLRLTATLIKSTLYALALVFLMMYHEAGKFHSCSTKNIHPE